MLEETGTGPNRIGDVVRGMLEIGTPVPVLVQERPLPLVQIDCVLPEGGGGLFEAHVLSYNYVGEVEPIQCNSELVPVADDGGAAIRTVRKRRRKGDARVVLVLLVLQEVQRSRRRSGEVDGAEGTDAFSQCWAGEHLLLHAPVSRLGDVVTKLDATPAASAVVVAPYWTGAPWFEPLARLAKETLVLPAGSLRAVAQRTGHVKSWRAVAFHVPRRD